MSEELKNQSFPSFEVLIIDDASTIPIKDVVDEINDSRFKYIRNKKTESL
jgi:glycosyltransferase involved in cell wall biosynthesis